MLTIKNIYHNENLLDNYRRVMHLPQDLTYEVQDIIFDLVNNNQRRDLQEEIIELVADEIQINDIGWLMAAHNDELLLKAAEKLKQRLLDIAKEAIDNNINNGCLFN